jgi:hypothetical protein
MRLFSARLKERLLQDLAKQNVRFEEFNIYLIISGQLRPDYFNPSTNFFKFSNLIVKVYGSKSNLMHKDTKWLTLLDKLW